MQKHSQPGVLYAMGAFGIWGIIPIYFKLVDSVQVEEVLAHRILWSLILLLIIITISRRWKPLFDVLRSKKRVAPLFISSLLISSNWLIFIWAVSHNRISETSLGYFINPLFSVLLGVLFLKEKLRFWQGFAIVLALTGVSWQVFSAGHLPVLALFLTLTFGLYGFMRKQIQVDPITGLTVETLLLSPFAIGYLYWLSSHGELAFLHRSAHLDALLIFAGVITTSPLLLFAAAAHRLRLITLGIMLYISPSIALILAVLYYNEPFGMNQLITFSFIWAAVAVFTLEAIYFQRKESRLPAHKNKKNSDMPDFDTLHSDILDNRHRLKSAS